MHILDPRRILAIPAVYKLFQRIFGGETYWKPYIYNQIKLKGGERVLDIGCGPGYIVPWLPENVDYHGIDFDAEYIASAQSQYGDTASFYHRNINAKAVDDMGKFDVIIATGVLHHIDDKTASDLFESAANALMPNGRLVTCDPVKGEKTNPIAKILIALDRGKYVRNRANYKKLAQIHFTKVDINVYHNQSRLPYVHSVMQCQSPA